LTQLQLSWMCLLWNCVHIAKLWEFSSRVILAKLFVYSNLDLLRLWNKKPFMNSSSCTALLLIDVCDFILGVGYFHHVWVHLVQVGLWKLVWVVQILLCFLWVFKLCYKVCCYIFYTPKEGLTNHIQGSVWMEDIKI
jgi:hypothetical protein